MKEKIMRKAEMTPWGDVLYFVLDEDTDIYSIKHGDKVLISAEGKASLHALSSYFDTYYNGFKHVLYPQMPYPESVFDLYKSIRYDAMDKIEEFYDKTYGDEFSDDMFHRSKTCLDIFKKIIRED